MYNVQKMCKFIIIFEDFKSAQNDQFQTTWPKTKLVYIITWPQSLLIFSHFTADEQYMLM